MKYDDIYSFKLPGRVQHLSFHLTIPTIEPTNKIGEIPAGIKTIVTEIEDNQCMSVTNAACQIGREICRWFDIPADRLVQIEFYPKQPLAYQSVSDTISSNSTYRPTPGEWSIVNSDPSFVNCHWQCLTLAGVGYLRDFITAYR